MFTETEVRKGELKGLVIPALCHQRGNLSDIIVQLIQFLLQGLAVGTNDLQLGANIG